MTSKRNLEQRFESLADDDGPGEGSARTSAYTPDLSESDYEFFMNCSARTGAICLENYSIKTMTNKRNLERRFERLDDGTDEDDPGLKWADLPEPTPEEKERLDKRFDVVPATAVDPGAGGGNDGE